MSKMKSIHNFHVLLKNTPKSKVTHANFTFFWYTNLEKLQKVESNTFKNINDHIFLINVKICV